MIPSPKTKLVKKLLHIYNKQIGKKETLCSLLKNDKTKRTWAKAASIEYGRLMKGNNSGTAGTDTIEPVLKQDIPSINSIMYGSVVCDHRPLKPEPNRCRLFVGGDKLTYDNETAAPAANLLETKIMLDSVISITNANFFTIGIKDFFLSSSMLQPEFIQMHIDDIPSDIISKYDLPTFVDSSNHVNFKMKKTMYGLKQAAMFAYKQMKKNLAPHGYYPIPNIVGLWKYATQPIHFCLYVDNFGIKFEIKEDADHLVNTLRKFYQIAIDWSVQ